MTTVTTAQKTPQRLFSLHLIVLVLFTIIGIRKCSYLLWVEGQYAARKNRRSRALAVPNIFGLAKEVRNRGETFRALGASLVLLE